MTSYLLLILTSICWGSWANALNFTRKYKQNLFYLDFTIATLFFSIFIWLLSKNELSSLLSLKSGLPLLGGALFAIGNLLLVKSIDKYGFSLSFPSIIGGAVIIGGLLNFIKTPKNNPLLFFPGLALVLLAIIADSYLYKIGSKNSTQKSLLTGKSVVELFLGALFIGIFPLFWNYGAEVFEISELFLILLVGHSLGIILVAIFSNYLTYTDFKIYLKTMPLNHIISSAGAAIWVLGTYLNMTIGTKVGFGVSFVVGNIAPLFSALWGIFYWKEININKPNARLVFSLTALLFLIGLVFIGKS